LKLGVESESAGTPSRPGLGGLRLGVGPAGPGDSASSDFVSGTHTASIFIKLRLRPYKLRLGPYGTLQNGRVT
jgi:hypothetical protein